MIRMLEKSITYKEKTKCKRWDECSPIYRRKYCVAYGYDCKFYRAGIEKMPRTTNVEKFCSYCKMENETRAMVCQFCGQNLRE